MNYKMLIIKLLNRLDERRLRLVYTHIKALLGLK